MMTMMITTMVSDNKRAPREAGHAKRAGGIDQKLHDLLEGAKLALFPPVPAEPSQPTAVNVPRRIIRTYQCLECNYSVMVTLAAEDSDAPPPDCPKCRQMRQEFVAPSINVGSTIPRAIVIEDYHVADIQMDRCEGTAEPNQRSAVEAPATGKRLKREAPTRERVKAEMRAKLEAGEVTIDELRRNKESWAIEFKCGSTTAYDAALELQEEMKQKK